NPSTLSLFDATHNSTKKSSNNMQNMQASNLFHSSAGFYFMFFHPTMLKQYNNDYNFFTNSLPQIQQTNNSGPLLTIHEFFENLKKTYDENNFNEVKNKFLQKEIDVLNMLSLKDYDWQNLEIKLD
ncbi:6286_t:CDS:1, partial [Funneliformis caledonium]